MPTTLTTGNNTISTTEIDLFDITGVASYATEIFTHNMAGGDTFVIRIYTRDTVSGAFRLFAAETLTGDQAEDAKYIDYLTTSRYKVSIQKTGGTDRNFTWERKEIT